MKKLWIILPALILSTTLLAGCGKKDTTDNLAIQGELEDQIDALEAQNIDLSYPAWLKDLNFDEPKGLELNQSESYVTTEKVEGFNSVHFSYDGDYDTAMEQAEIVANKAGVELSEEFKMAQDMIDNMGIENIEMQELMGDLKGALYTNYTLMDKPNVDYMISITVDEDGTLEIDVADRVKMEEIATNYTK